MWKAFVLFIFLLLLGIAVTVYTRPVTPPPAKAAPVKPTGAVYDVHSSKADRKLILRTKARPDGTTTYEFFIDSMPLFAKNLGAGASMSIPFNAWDPTDTYVFIEEKDGGAVNYFVVAAAGGPVIDVGAVWKEKQIPYTIREATGWASGTLLIIYTTASDGSRGPAFWFEIPSTAIIQLSG